MKVCSIHIDESVFALSFKENLAVFNESGDNDGTVICIRLRVFSTIDTGVGIVLVCLLSGFARTFFETDESDSTLSFSQMSVRSLAGPQNSHDEMKKLFVFLACGVAAIALSSCTKSAWERSYSHKSYVKVGDLKWATKNVGATKDNPYGELFTYEQALKACPDGWRLPSRTELRMVTQNFSSAVSYDGMSGKWFSGTTPYEEGAEAVFLPYAGGHMHESDEGQYFDTVGYYWSSTRESNNLCWILYFADFSLETPCLTFSSYHKFSVRCLKD